MERDEAKAILELCRPGNSDDLQDPLIAEALGLLGTDAELKAWFDEQQALDGRIADTYNSIEPPTDLKASILAGMRAHAHSQQQAESAPADEPIPFTTSAGRTSQAWWRSPWIGVAAVFALLLAIVFVPQGEPEQTQFVEIDPNSDVPEMIQFLAAEIDAVTSRERRFAKKSKEPAKLQAYLASAGAPSPETLPSAVDNKPSLGCFTFKYNGATVGMICFKNDELMHLTTIRKTDCMGEFPDEPAIYEINDQAFKVWVEGDQVQILSVHGNKEKLPEFI